MDFVVQRLRDSHLEFCSFGLLRSCFNVHFSEINILGREWGQGGVKNDRLFHVKQSRRLGGMKAQKNGKDWQDGLEQRMSLVGWHVIRIEDGCKRVGGNRLIPVRQPFDNVACGPNNVDIFFDAKRRSIGKKIVPSMFAGASTEHQLRHLETLANLGRKAGFIVYLDETDEVWWVPVKPMGRFRRFGPEPISWGHFRTGLRIRFNQDAVLEENS